MIKLLKKEIKLSYLPIVWFFPLLSALLLIPQYPYCVGVSYCILNIFCNFNYAAENRDTDYMSALPVPRRDIVKSKIASGYFMELMQIAVAVVCGLISAFALWGENSVGLDANFTFYGFLLLGLAVFNALFFPMYFARGCRVGISMIVAAFSYFLLVFLEEIIVGVVPAVHKALDGFSAEYIGIRAAVFAVGFVLYAVSLPFSYLVSVKKFEGVSL